MLAARYTPLGVVYPTVGYDSEKIYIWAAEDLSTTGQHLDPDEFLDVIKVPFAKAVEMVMDGTIKDSKSIAGILKYALLRKGRA